MATTLERIKKIEAGLAARDARVNRMTESDKQHRTSQMYGVHARLTQLLDLARDRMDAADALDHTDLA